MDAYEQQLLEMLSRIRQDYERAAAPVIKRLVELRALKPPGPFVFPAMSIEDADAVTAHLRKHFGST